MAQMISPDMIKGTVRDFITAEKTNLGIEVTVPVLYDDGSMVSAVIEPTGEHFLVHDAGFSGMRLSTVGISLTKHVVVRLNELARRFHCSFVKGRVTSESTEATLPVTVCLVANASRAVADYALEIRRHSETDFRSVVFDQLREIVGARVRENEEFRGKSGRRYRVPAILLDPKESHPEHFVAMLAHRQVVPQHFAMFYDLHGAFPAVVNDSVYDESSDFRDEDRAFLQSVSNVMSFMEAPIRFRRLTGNA